MRCWLVGLAVSLAVANVAQAQTRPAGWGQAASSITRMLETSRPLDPAAFGTIAGDGDGQGFSVGTMQWNFGQGTIATLLARMSDADVVATYRMPTYGAAFVAQARASGVPATHDAAMAWARARQPGRVIDPVFRGELYAFLTDPSTMAAQDSFEEDYRTEAWALAAKWAHDVDGRPAPGFGEFAMFYDLRVQGGAGYLDDLELLLERYAVIFKDDRASAFSLKAVAAAGFISMREARPCAIPGTARVSVGGHSWDAQANCAIWRRLIARAELGDVQRELLVLAFMRSFLARDEFAINFYNRKGLLATGRGVANGWSCDFRPLYARLDGGGTASPDDVRGSCRAPLPAAGGPAF